MNGAVAVFLDRDGTLISDVGYLSRLDQVKILPRVAEAIRLLRDHGLKVVVTNQSAVARGLLGEKQLQRIHEELKRQLAQHGAFLDGLYYCPHHPTEGTDPYRVACDCRKPNVGMAARAAQELNVNLSQSYVVGDQWTDMEMAARIGARGIFIKVSERGDEAQGKTTATHAVENLWEAAQWIMLDRERKDR